ncbi:MAG: hypothetical protein ACQEXQ_19525 [Bacillota bacterium]
MSKLPNSNSGTGDDTGMRPNEDRPPSTPRWVKVAGIIVLVLVLLFVTMKLTGVGGHHGPMRHMQSSSDIEQGVKQP